MYRIYIVEDDKGIAEGIGACLKDWGMETRCAADFCRVVDEFEEYRPHLVLLDVKLPFMDGYHWCREIRRVSDVPILFISSVADNMNIVMAMNMGGDDFVSKPFDQGVLVAKVQALLRRAYDFRQNDMLVRAAGAVRFQSAPRCFFCCADTYFVIQCRRKMLSDQRKAAPKQTGKRISGKVFGRWQCGVTFRMLNDSLLPL